jgi:hypothetical protein
MIDLVLKEKLVQKFGAPMRTPDDLAAVLERVAGHGQLHVADPQVFSDQGLVTVYFPEEIDRNNGMALAALFDRLCGVSAADMQMQDVLVGQRDKGGAAIRVLKDNFEGRFGVPVPSGA